MKELIINQDIPIGTIDWIDFFIAKGTIVYKSYDPYNVCTDDGIPVVFEKDTWYPYVEIPKKYLVDK